MKFICHLNVIAITVVINKLLLKVLRNFENILLLPSLRLYVKHSNINYSSFSLFSNITIFNLLFAPYKPFDYNLKEKVTGVIVLMIAVLSHQPK